MLTAQVEQTMTDRTWEEVHPLRIKETLKSLRTEQLAMERQT